LHRHSAGILAYRRDRGRIELFLVHPGGPFWHNRDVHAWSIPKGEFENEEPLAAARREFEEETGQSIDGDFVSLGSVRGRGKTIHAYAVESTAPDPAQLRSNLFEMEWPPGTGRIGRFPEVDRAAWVPLEEAREKLHRNQLTLVDLLQRHLPGR
jgi:predicted NUDIX family NTP pyrophosphohydrolase